MSPRQIRLSGSESRSLPGSRAIGDLDPNAPIQVILRLRRRPADESGAAGSSKSVGGSESADLGDLAQVQLFAEEYGLMVLDADLENRRMVLSGRAAAVAAAFCSDLGKYKIPAGVYRDYGDSVCLPPGLAEIITEVHGLRDRP